LVLFSAQGFLEESAKQTVKVSYPNPDIEMRLKMQVKMVIENQEIGNPESNREKKTT